MRSPSLDFALRAILRMSQFAPGELVLCAQEKAPKEKGTRRPRRHVFQQIPRGGISRAFLAVPGARITRQPHRVCLRQDARLDPGSAAVLGAAYGTGVIFPCP